MLGLDGSFVFLEHVFWVVSLNTLFILIFAYLPHQMGKLLISNLYSGDLIRKNLHFEGAINTVIGKIQITLNRIITYVKGYCMFGFMFMISHVISAFMNMEKMSQLAKLLYICIKAAIFMLFESFVTPLFCGCWIDVCSLSLMESDLYKWIVFFEIRTNTKIRS